MVVSDRLFGISDLPYSRARIRILAEEERKNRIVIIYLFIYWYDYHKKVAGQPG